jgi:hypothetical protein
MAKTIKTVASETTKKADDSSRPVFAFGKENYLIMLAGVALLIIGFILMTGGGSKDPNVFNEDMFDFRRLTLSPILILVGFGLGIVAIMKRPKD